MEAPTIKAQVEVLMGPQDADNNNTRLVVIKGKRTKRQRPQSPIPLAIIPYGDGGGGGNNMDQYGTNIFGLTNNNNNKTTNLTPNTSIEFQENTEEEEDMAKCLILLAQGQFRPRTSPKPSSPDEDAGINKYNSQRLLETSAAGGTCKAGYYVYECRTCNRTFPSFQALGGHRASHKKPKAIIGLLSSDEDYDQSTSTLKCNNVSSSALSLQSSHRSNNNNNNNNHKPKVHECSICGAEFTSGQALGGHMRRHRAPIGTNTTLSLTPISMKSDHHEQFEQPKKAKSVLSLDLDLNLPAPEDDNRDSKFTFVSSKQKKQQKQSSLVFSSPALVDCHY